MQYIGREVKKTFKSHGEFTGKVLDYDKKTGFRIEYEDGDTEDVKETDLLKILTKTLRMDGPAALSGMPRRNAPAARMGEGAMAAPAPCRRRRGGASS